MRYGIIAENPVEAIGLASGQVPTPMLEPYGAGFGRALMVATKVGVFDALADSPLGAVSIAERCSIDAHAAEKLLNLLVGMRYLRRSRDGAYRLTSLSRRWLLETGGRSVRDMVLMKFLEWEWIEGLEVYVRTGEPLDVHGGMSTEDWRLYHGMRAQSGLLERELGPAVEGDEPLAVQLEFDGHHLPLAARCARALRPGGIFVIGDLMRPDSPSGSSAMDLFYDLYFALISRSGLWSFDEMADWQRQAGLEPRKPMRLFPGQGIGLQIAERPGRSAA